MIFEPRNVTWSKLPMVAWSLYAANTTSDRRATIKCVNMSHAKEPNQ